MARFVTHSFLWILAVCPVGCGRVGYVSNGSGSDASRDSGADGSGDSEPLPIDGGADGSRDGGPLPTDGGADGSRDSGPVPSDCPAGYVPVPGSPLFGTVDFCVMQFEAKAWDDANGDSMIAVSEVQADGCDAACSSDWGLATHVPVSVPFGLPYRKMRQTSASALCRALGPGFDLVSNPEAMTMARNFELQGVNWSGGSPGSGRVVEGTTDGGPQLQVSDPSDDYSDTGSSASDAPGAGWEQRRTFYLSNGERIWDFAGNVQEWIDWTVGGSLDSPPGCAGNSEISAVVCPELTDDDYNSSTGIYDSSQGIGKFIGGTGSAARRGGQMSDFSNGNAGIYGLNMNRNADQTFPSTGFRCVFRSPRG